MLQMILKLKMQSQHHHFHRLIHFHLRLQQKHRRRRRRHLRRFQQVQRRFHRYYLEMETYSVCYRRHQYPYKLRRRQIRQIRLLHHYQPCLDRPQLR